MPRSSQRCDVVRPVARGQHHDHGAAQVRVALDLLGEHEAVDARHVGVGEHQAEGHAGLLRFATACSHGLGGRPARRRPTSASCRRTSSRMRRLVALSSTTSTAHAVQAGRLRRHGLQRARRSATSRRTSEMEAAATARLRSRPRCGRPSGPPAARRWPAPGPCRRGGAWSRCRPARTSRRSPPASPAECRCPCRRRRSAA